MGVQAWQWPMFQSSTLSREADMTMLLHVDLKLQWLLLRAYQAQIAVLAFLAKAVGKPMAWRPKPLIWCTNCLSLPNRSNQPLSEKKWSDEKVRDGNNAMLSISDVARLLCCYGSQSETKEISYINVKASLRRVSWNTVPSLWSKGTVIASCQTSPSQPHAWIKWQHVGLCFNQLRRKCR